MISFLLYSHIKKELSALKSCSADVSGKISDEDLSVYDFYAEQELWRFIEGEPVLDISCVDVAGDVGIKAAEELRKSNGDMYIILISEPSVSPAKYIKPSIMAGSLLLRPLSGSSVKKVFAEAFGEYLKKLKGEENEGSFVINNHDGRQLIPLKQILYFESREKKIFIVTKSMEYSFYDTLDSLEERLGDEFIRCHRSYIVSKSRISKVMISKSIIKLDTGYMVPLSRSYKSIIKELTK